MKLLNKSLRALSLYALVVLTLSVPVYYGLVNWLWQEAIDENHYAVKEKLTKRLNGLALNEQELAQTIENWNHILGDDNVRIIPSSQIRPDSVYTRLEFDEDFNEQEPFRCLSTFLSVHGRVYQLTLRTNLEESEEIVTLIAIVAFLFLLVLLGGFFWLSRRQSVQIWQKLDSILQKLTQFDLKTSPDMELEPTGILEFDALNNALNQLIEKNRSIYREQKEFTENASHELQTPLAVLQTKTDLLFQTPNLTERQAELLDEMKQAIGRVSRLNRNLLLLTKIENRQFTETQSVNITRLIERLLNDYSESIALNSLRLDVQLEPNVCLSVNESLAEILFSNLISNAVRHNRPGGRIEIRLSPAAFSIANTGEDVALNPDKLFKRFQTQNGKKKGVGLGLSIASKIAQATQWKLTYEYCSQIHCFELQFFA